MVRHGSMVTLLVAAGFTALAPPVAAVPSPASGARVSKAPAAVALSPCYSPDNGDPVLKTFTISPRDVDSRTGAQEVIFTATADDTGGPGQASGIARGEVEIRSSDGVNWLSAGLTPDGSGALVGRITILPQSPTATWDVLLLGLRDSADNFTNYPTTELERLGFPSTLTTTTNPDTARPALRSEQLSTSHVDTTRNRKRVTVTVRATDDAAVTAVRASLGGLAGPAPSARLHRASGTPTDGVWRGRIVVRRWSGVATARLYVHVTDAVGKFRDYPPRALEKLGLPSRVRVFSRSDREAPTIRIRPIPATVDLRSGAQPVVVVARVRDVGSGVKSVYVQMSGPVGSSEPRALSGRLRRSSGTLHDGIWKAVVTPNPCLAPAGVWHAAVTASDRIRGATADKALTLVNGDVAPPRAVVANYPVPRTGPVGVRFSEDVVGVDISNTLVHAGDTPDGVAGEEPAPISGTWACRDAAGAGVDCSAGPVRTAEFTPAAPMLPATNHTVLMNPEHHLGLTDLAGNPYSRHNFVVYFSTN